MRLRSRLLPLLLGSVVAACAAPPSADVARLREARYVLLGEVHDNAEQHRRRAALLRALLADGRPSAVVFEQMDRTQDAALAAAPRDADALAGAGALDRAAWRWPLHRPLVQAAADGGARVLGGNLPLAEVRDIVRGGANALPADLRPLLADADWPPAAEAALQREIDHGHCHALPPAMRAPMALAQRARDAAMADALLRAAGAGATRVVLIAGNGHVRKDRGVALYLRRAGVAAPEIVTVGYLEEGDAQDDAPYDISYRTERAARADPCAAFKAR